jgi:hypothetical protein
MSNALKRAAIAFTVATLGGAWLISQAQGAPTATKSGNVITASGTVDSTYDPASPTVAIRGQITATGHKFGPRHCLAGRDVWASHTDLSGQVHTPDADRPTNGKGRFKFSQIEIKYGSADNGGDVPPAGGQVTFTLTLTPERVPKRRGDITDSFKCPNVSTTVQVQVPPGPPSLTG